MKTYRKQILIAVGTVVVIALGLNFQYFWAQIKYAVKTPEPIEVPDQGEKGEPNRLAIESLGIQAPIVYTEAQTEKEYQQALAMGVVHYPNSAKIGEVGNAYIFGHSSDFPWKPGEYKTVFALLPKIENDAVITVTDEQGRVFRYKVMETKVVSSNDFSVLSQDTGGKKILTLQTSYPVGTALKRFIVISELLD